MIIQCQGCAAKYFLPEEKVPENPLKVKCPKCTAVFMLVPQREAAMAAAPAPAPAAASAATGAPPSNSAAVQADPPAASPDAPPAPTTPEAAPNAAKEAAVPKSAPGGTRRGGRSKEDRAKRLARVLVSDILWYNREKRDQALVDGTLMNDLGEEIKKSWELYKEKVGPDLAGSTNYFKEALNEILADGQEVF